MVLWYLTDHAGRTYKPSLLFRIFVKNSSLYFQLKASYKSQILRLEEPTGEKQKCLQELKKFLRRVMFNIKAKQERSGSMQKNSPGTNSTKNEDGMNVSGKKAAGNLSERKVDVHVMTGRTDPSSSRERICPHISLQVMKGDAGSGSAPCAPRTVAAFPAGRGLQGSPAETRRSF